MWRLSLSGAAVVYGVLIMALPLIFAVLNGIGIGSAGGWMVPLALGIALAVSALALLMGRTSIEFPKNILVVVGLPLFLSSCISIVGHQSFSTMIFGTSLELGTLGSLAVFAVSIVFGAGVSGRQALRILDVFIVSSAIGGAVTLWQVFTSGWGDIASLHTVSLIVLGALIVSAIGTDIAMGRARFAYGLSTVFLGVLSVLLFDTSGGSIAAVILLLVFGFALFHGKSLYVSWVTVLVACAIGASLLAGMEGRYVSASPDVRPSLSVTASIVGAQYFQDARSAFLGNGPNTFNRAWERYRTAELNVSQFWGTDTRGADIVGSRLPALPAVALASFAFGVSFTDRIETPLFLAGGMALGMVARAFEHRGNIVKFDFSFGGSRIVAGLLAIIALCLALWLVQISLRPIRASVYHARILALPNTEDALASKLELYDQLVKIWRTSPYALEASGAFVERARIAGERADRYNFRISTDRALAHAGTAIDSDPGNYQVWLYRGSLLIALISSDYPNAAADAYADLQRAKMLAPMRPDILYQEAVLHASFGRKVDARIALEKALELKPDYAEALSLLESLSD
ncbi:MAG: hypothetical protein Athens041674_917 [Parcubacteria group bacterium Athens0416_74]|nr:MAG: hypothetical protein Athens041674_917 [Parcubacteria group bacterium Athens0416_74]